MKIKNKIKFKDAYSSEIRILVFFVYNIIASLVVKALNKKYHVFTNTFLNKVIATLIFVAITCYIAHIVRRTLVIYRTKNNNRKMPPTIEEIKELGITSVEQYFVFLKKNVKIPTFDDASSSDVNNKSIFQSRTL